MSLALHVRTLGRGPGRSRSLTQDESFDAMTLMLQGAAPEAVGALLMLLRMKGETAAEIAGFAAAAQASLSPAATMDLDWPSYAAGRTRGLPWFLLSARLVALAGYRVLLHGWNGTDPSVRAGISELGIPVGGALASIPHGGPGITYFPLEDLSPALFTLLGLRQELGLRSCVNTVCRMLNPGRARASVSGVFHPSYRELQSSAGYLLGRENLTVIKGGGGEFERLPSKAVTAEGLRQGQFWRSTAPVLIPENRRLDDGETDVTKLSALWAGDYADPFAEAVVIGTAALALDTLGESGAEQRARALWSARHGRAAA